MKVKNKKLPVVLLLFFVAMTAFLYYLLDSRRDHTYQRHLQLITERYQLAFNTIYDQYKQLAVNTNKGLMERYDILGVYHMLSSADEEQKNRLRKKLYSSIKKRYEELTLDAKVRQLHFHLPTNESFLRFHRPEKYGDNLTEIRETINYVNTNFLPIDGFEEGRIYNGFRFVFPITATNKTHLGSMEISFSPAALTSSIMKQYVVLSNFFIKEETVKRKVFLNEQNTCYSKSHHKGYLYDNNVLQVIKNVSRKNMKKLKPHKDISNTIYANAHSGSAKSLYDPSTNMVFTTIPVFNPVTNEMTAFLTVRSQSDYFIDENHHFMIVFSLSLLLLVMTYSVFFIQFRKKELLEASTEQLESQRQQLVYAQGIASLGHWSLDLATNHLSWSDQIYHIFDIPPQKFVATYKAFLKMVHPDDRAFVKTSYSHFLKQRQPYDIQHRIITRNGDEKWVREICTTEYDKSGKALRSLGIVHDITLQHDTFTLLQRERDMFMNGPVVTVTWQNSDGWPMEQVSRNVVDILGYPVEAFLSGSVEYVTLIHPDDLQRVTAEVVSNSVPQKNSFIHDPYRLLSRSGKTVWVLHSSTLVRDHLGNITHYQGYFVDITKMVLMEREVAKAKSHLRTCLQEEQLKHFESLKTMAGAIAHRFNNAMTAVTGNLDMIKYSLADDSSEYQMATEAAQAARAATQIGSTMLSYAGQQTHMIERVDFSNLVKESVTEFKKHLSPLITLGFISPSQSIFSSIDEQQIKQVLKNILTNSLESLGNDTGIIEITFGTDYFSMNSFPVLFQNDNIKGGMYVFCQVKDTGHGISTKDVSRIFDPFYTTKFVGRGLGLALTIGIMQSHNGAITIESSPDKGTTARVLLPA